MKASGKLSRDSQIDNNGAWEGVHEAAKILQDKGAKILGDGKPRIGAHGKPVIFLHPKEFFGTLIELEQR